MRTIKFRAWDKKRHQMLKVSEMLWFYSTIGKDNFENNGVSSVEGELHVGYEKTMGIPLGDSNIMQFTGLLDKNGKEIYEGDIVSTGKEDWHDSDTDGNYEIIWGEKELMFGFRTENGEHAESLTFWIDNQYKQLEVVGNIYENPELLKQY